MSIFSKPKLVIWPKNDYLEIYADRKDNNIFTFEINLWKEHTQEELKALAQFIKETPHSSITILVPDDIVLIKSFIYDSVISSIEKKEVIGLAESFVPFKIDPEYLTYKLIQRENKTIIQSQIFQKDKIEMLKKNLQFINLPINEFISVSQAISKVVSTFYQSQYFFIYPLNTNEYTLFLSKNDAVYLTANIKGPSLDVQKHINYSALYFTEKTKKIYVPTNDKLEIIFTTELEKTHYLDSQIATELKKPSNYPLPVLGVFTTPNSQAPVIISQNNNSTNNLEKPKKMENKKNYLPIIAVFVFTAALASIIIWFIVNKNKTESASAIPTPTEEAQVTPTAIPTPEIVELDKKLKIQVLNGTEINGQAAILKDMLAKLDFESISVGNAKESATENKIAYKKSIKGVEEYFTAKLNTDYPATFDDSLKETSTYDVVFTIGTDLKSTTTKTATSSAKVTLAPTKTATATPTSEP